MTFGAALILAFAVVGSTLQAGAAPVYKCTKPGSDPTYSMKPCASGDDEAVLNSGHASAPEPENADQRLREIRKELRDHEDRERADRAAAHQAQLLETQRTHNAAASAEQKRVEENARRGGSKLGGWMDSDKKAPKEKKGTFCVSSGDFVAGATGSGGFYNGATICR